MPDQTLGRVLRELAVELPVRAVAAGDPLQTELRPVVFK
jgi:hypothetical protein